MSQETPEGSTRASPILFAVFGSKQLSTLSGVGGGRRSEGDQMGTGLLLGKSHLWDVSPSFHSPQEQGHRNSQSTSALLLHPLC